MKTRYSWELILIGFFIIGVGLYLYSSNPTDSDDVTTSSSLENILQDEVPIDEMQDETSDDFSLNSDETHEIANETDGELDPLLRSQTDEEAIATTAPDPTTGSDLADTRENSPEIEVTSTQPPSEVKTESAPERLTAIGTVLNQVGSTVDEITRSGDFNNRFNENKARLVKEERFPAFALAEVKANLDTGNLQLVTHSGSDIVVQIWISERNSSSDFNRFFSTTISKNPETLTVQVRRREQDESWISRLQRLWATDVGNSIAAGVRILVPEGGLTYTLSTQTGNIEAYSAGGDITLETRAGNILVDGLYGKIVAETRAGNIRADNLSGTVALRTRAGNIVADNLRATTELRSRAGNITATALTANHRIDAESRVGNVDLRIPTNTRADLSIDGSSVTLHESFTLDGDSDARYVRGTLNGGGPLIRVHARVGNSRILPLE